MWTRVYQAAIAAACRWGRGATRCRRLLWGRRTHLRPSFSLKSYLRCPVSTGWPGLRSTSRVGSPPAHVGAVGRWLFWHERRWVSRGFEMGHTAEIQDDSSLGPPMAFLAWGSQLLVLFSRSLEFWAGACRSWGSRRKVVGCCPGVQALAVRGCCVGTPVDMLAIEVANVQTGVWERRDGRMSESRAWRFVDVDDLVICDVYTQPLSLWLIWRLIDQWPFHPLVDKRGKAVIPAQDWPSSGEVGNH